MSNQQRRHKVDQSTLDALADAATLRLNTPDTYDIAWDLGLASICGLAAVERIQDRLSGRYWAAQAAHYAFLAVPGLRE